MTKLLLIFLFCLIGHTLAIYQDQAGNLEWYKKYVGLTEDAVVYANKPRLCVQTTSSLIGCLNLRDGDIVFRKSFNKQPKGLIVSESGNTILTVSDGKLIAINNDGAFLWEAKIAEEGDFAQIYPLLNEEKHVQAVLAVSGDKIQVYDAVNGKQLESIDNEDVSKPLQYAFGNLKSSSVVAYESGSSLLEVFPVASGAASVSRVASVALSPITSATESFLAILSADRSSLCIVTRKSTSASVNCAALPASSLSIASASDVVLRAAASSVVLSSKRLGQISLVKVKSPSSPALSLSELWSAADAYVASAPVISGDTAFFAAVSLKEAAVPITSSSSSSSLAAPTASVQVVDVSSGPVGAIETTSVPELYQGLSANATALRPVIFRAALGIFSRKDKSLGFRVALFMTDGQIILLQQSQVVWHRDEALASITSSPLFLDLPAPSAAAAAAATAVSATKANLTERFRYQMLGLKMQVKLASPSEKREYKKLREKLSTANLPLRDVNGFRKLVVALVSDESNNKVGARLVAFHNGDGRTLWKTLFADDEKPDRVLPYRVFHDISHAPQVLLLRTAEPRPYAAVVNAHTGEILERVNYYDNADGRYNSVSNTNNKGIAQVVPIHERLHDGTAEQSLYLLVSYDSAKSYDTRCTSSDSVDPSSSSSPMVRMVPDTPASRAYLANNYRKIFFWTQQSSSALCGFGFDASSFGAVGLVGSSASVRASTSSATPLVLTAVRTWTQLVPENQAILALAGRDPNEPIPSSVKVMLDRAIKYKYVRPNLLFVAVGRPNGAPVALEEDPLAVELTTFLLDTVTGAVLLTQTHLGARGPVTALISENLLVYTFWDLSAARSTVMSQELYDATPKGFSVLDYLFNPNSTQPTSSFLPAPIDTVSQVFFMPLQPEQLFPTATRQGLTMKQVLVRTNTNQVFMIDRRFLNPRRPKKQKLSQEEVEDGLIPYQEILPFVASHFLTLDKSITGLSTGGRGRRRGYGSGDEKGVGEEEIRREEIRGGGVTVAPVHLESSCHVLVNGVDVFYTRLRPAMAFDSLDDDFNYALLVVALLGLGAGAMALSRFSQRVVLKQKWR
eukprot:CAMPEP_0175051584 /NCGR_PEP_ID=MMETSP0052_2-20121109/7888_1 /TAXON_ID=51329 ORGANISM="Polytomella parva, Strain SAG 63-3" /NCGR_SAMPLE_ID=MMETSP0052_2 /ASSEMBLY_ACC=CAM_ASM_000194 /LENGTH=1079 /DNA_ID=CAMNT_0016315899 /DNA_START=94 /DNA_END=3333 /DNA_ORIENTATION=+